MSTKTTTAFAAIVAAGFFSVAPIAHADTTTSGNGSIGGGNQAIADADVPINVCGNAIAVLGTAGADCEGGGASSASTGSTDSASGGGASVAESEGDTKTSGNGSLLGGNQLGADVDAPVNACGNAAGVAGNAGADCENGETPPDSYASPSPEESTVPQDGGDYSSPSPSISPSSGAEDEPSPAPSESADAPTDNRAAPATDAAADAGELPVTGAGLLPLLAGGAAALAAGLGLVVAVRRKRRTSA